jgi:hypothetical protein
VTGLPTFADSGQLSSDTDNAIAWASDAIRTYCGWHIYPNISETLTVDTVGGKVLGIPSLKVTAVASVTVGGVLLDALAYEWSERGMLRRLDYCCWPTGFQSVAVALNHGFQSAPDALVQVCVSAASRMPYQLAGVKAETAAQVSRTYGADMSGGFGADGWTAAEQAVLDTYRVRSLP